MENAGQKSIFLAKTERNVSDIAEKIGKKSRRMQLLPPQKKRRKDNERTRKVTSCWGQRLGWPNVQTLSLKLGRGCGTEIKKKNFSPNENGGNRRKVNNQTRKVMSFWGQRPAGQTSRLVAGAWAGVRDKISKNPFLQTRCAEKRRNRNKSQRAEPNLYPTLLQSS